MATIKLPKGYSKYGAQMGRMSFHATDRSLPLKLQLQHMRLDSGGYDNGGAYWGTGQPMFIAEGYVLVGDEQEKVTWFFRASDREAAKLHVKAEYPNARFYR